MARDGQKQIGLFLKVGFLEEIDEALARLGYADRSTFIRDAVYEKLTLHGVSVPQGLQSAPSRSGKGGKPSHKKATKKKAAVYEVPHKQEQMVAEDGGTFNGKPIRVLGEGSEKGD